MVSEGGDDEDVEDPELEGEQRSITVRRQRRSRGSETDRLFRRFAESRGYRWEEDTRSYVHRDGSRIVRAEEPFDWLRRESNGDGVHRYWVTSERLDGKGVEIPALVWQLLVDAPTSCSIVMPDGDGRPQELTGQFLHSAVAREEMALHPDTYRLTRGPR
ncbi:MAG: hypothetical protein N3C12_00960 [Candidatus Binatia bacterium]|nr:hypothetical protein [Candidatus Binatia bacterium]